MQSLVYYENLNPAVFLLITREAVWVKVPKVLFIDDSITDGNWGNSDGIHPTPAGHKRMADLWIEEIEKYHVL